MASADILRAARARIEDPKNWTQGAFAKLADGRGTISHDPDAVCWCAIGAVRAEAGTRDQAVEYYLTWAALRHFGVAGASVVNDCNGHASVLKMYDAAIAAAEAEAGH